MKYYMLAIKDNGDFCDIRVMNDDEYVIKKGRYEELIQAENRYKESLDALKTHTLVEDNRLLELHNIEKEYKEIIRQIKVDDFKPHYTKDIIAYAVHMLKGYLREYLKANTTKSTGLVEKRMLVVSFCHRIEEGLIDYLDDLEEFNS